MKKILLLMMVLTLAVSATAFADDVVTGRGLRQGLQLEGEALEAFHEEMLADKQVWIDKLVEDGKITASEGEAFITQMKDGFENCDGESKQLGQQLSIGAGKGFGAMSGQRKANGPSDGTGNRMQARWQTTE